mgnify:FL=1
MTDKEKSIYRDIIHLLTDNTTVHENLEKCLESSKGYLISNFDRFDERGMDADDNEHDIVWIAIVDELLETGKVVELDCRVELEDFLYAFQPLVEDAGLELLDKWFDEDESVPQWCNILDKKWLSKDAYVVGIDIDSDSYVIFPSQRETLKKLVLLGKQLNHRIDLAKNL